MKMAKEHLDTREAGFTMPIVFAPVDVARAFGKGMSWAWGFLNALESKGLVVMTKPGKYKFCWRDK